MPPLAREPTRASRIILRVATNDHSFEMNASLNNEVRIFTPLGLPTAAPYLCKPTYHSMPHQNPRPTTHIKNDRQRRLGYQSFTYTSYTSYTLQQYGVMTRLTVRQSTYANDDSFSATSIREVPWLLSHRSYHNNRPQSSSDQSTALNVLISHTRSSRRPCPKTPGMLSREEATISAIHRQTGLALETPPSLHRCIVAFSCRKHCSDGAPPLSLPPSISYHMQYTIRNYHHIYDTCIYTMKSIIP